jgi:hypothetical protein
LYDDDARPEQNLLLFPLLWFPEATHTCLALGFKSQNS